MQCPSYVDEQPRDIAEKKKETSKKVAAVSNAQADAIERLVATDHAIGPDQLNVVLQRLGKRAMEIAIGTCSVTTSEMFGILHDNVIEAKDGSPTAFMAFGQGAALHAQAL